MHEVGIILIASFGIDRIVRGVFFLLCFHPDLEPLLDPDSIRDPDERTQAAKKFRLIYAIFAGYLGVVIFAGQLGVRLSAITGLASDPKTDPIFSGWLDILLTGLLLAGGADRLSEGMKSLSEGGKKEAKTPVEITGKVVLEQGALKAESTGAATRV